MEFGFYLLLILALVTVAGFMLYARFSASREKGLHHPPVNVEAERSEPAEPVEETFEPASEEVEVEESVSEEQPAIRAEAIAAEKDEDTRKSEYLDELQEAAAGLAMLMRSSASNRTTPVVFAPEEEEEPSDSEPIETAISEEEVETVEAIEVPTEPEVDEEIVSEPEKKTLDVLLGEDVADQFNKLDSDLEVLESLVVEIESGLSVLVSEENEDSVVGESDEMELTEAA